jgi:hypothetical protein
LDRRSKQIRAYHRPDGEPRLKPADHRQIKFIHFASFSPLGAALTGWFKGTNIVILCYFINKVH